MDWKLWLKRCEEWFNRVFTIWGFLTAFAGAATTGVFGINGDFPPFLVFWFSLMAFTTTLIAIGLSASQRQSFIRIGGVWFIIVLGVFYALRVQNKAEAAKERETAVRAENYYLDYAGMAPSVTIVSGKPYTVSSVRTAITFNNPNDFGIWVKSVRRSVSILDKVSGDQQEDVLTYMPPRMKDQRFEDLPIVFDPPIYVPRGFGGVIDFYICYGKSKAKLNKGFALKGNMRFQSDAYGGFYAPDIYAANEGKGNGQTKGC